MDQIRRIPRPTDVPDSGIVCDLLWSDPDKDIEGWGENDRGVSFTFGGDVVAKFLKKHDLDLVCRAHQVVEDGYEFFAKRRLVTIFSAPNYCLAEGTLVTLADGTSVPIETIATDRATALMSYSSTAEGGAGGCIVKDTQAPFLHSQGVKNCVELTLNDGRSLVCTPDHRIITQRGEVQVQHLDHVTDRVIVAPQGAQRAHADESAWKWELNDLNVTLDSSKPDEFARMLAVARLAGAVDSADKERIAASHQIDHASLAADVQIALAAESVQKVDSAVELGERLAQQLASLAGFKSSLPSWVIDAATPVAVVREFLAAKFGSAATAPTVDADGFAPVRLSLTATEESKSDIVASLESDLMPLLKSRFGLESLVQVTPSKASLEWDMTLEVPSASTLAFSEKIGFRHNASKQHALGVAAGWYLASARQENIIVGAASVPSAADYLREIGSRDLAASHDSMPTWSVGISSVREVGPRATYDVSVVDTQLFLANGMVVHNCGEFDNAGAMMSVDETLMCSFQILKPAEKKAPLPAGKAGGK